MLPYCSRDRYLTRVKALSGWYSLVGVLAQERITSMLNTENPMTMVVKHSRAVFRNTFFFLRVANSPQKQSPKSSSMKNTAPELYGSPNTFTNSRSVYAASLGSQGIIT